MKHAPALLRGCNVILDHIHIALYALNSYYMLTVILFIYRMHSTHYYVAVVHYLFIYILHERHAYCCHGYRSSL